MIERYSHIRTEARREAMNALTLKAPTRSEEKRHLVEPQKNRADAHHVSGACP